MRLFLLIFLLSSGLLFSQESQRKIFSLHTAAGFNGCQVHGDSYSGYDKFGAFVGIAVDAYLSQRASAQLGFYFSQKGARHNPNYKTGDLSFYRLNLNYVDLPLSLKFRLNSKYFITGGPSIAYLINYTENINYTDMTGFYQFKKYEVGLNVGLGREFGQKFAVEVRSSNSISTIRSYGVLSNVFYPNPVARFFNKGFYNNILSVFVTFKIEN